MNSPTWGQHWLLLLILASERHVAANCVYCAEFHYWPIGQSKYTHKILFHLKTIGVLFRMSLPGRYKPIHKRIEIVRSFKMTRLMLKQIRAACDENNICFSHFMREAINQSLSWYNQQKRSYKTQQKVLDPSASVMA